MNLYLKAELMRRQRKLVKREKRLKEGSKLEKLKLKEGSKLERILRKEEKVRRKLEKREKEKVKSRLGSVIHTDTVRISRY